MALFQKSVLNQYLKQIDKIKVESAYQKFIAHFHNPIIQQQIRDSKEEQYQEGFLRDLFVDILGYTLNPQPNYNLTTELKNETNSKKVDGAILQNGNAIAVIELKGTNTTDLGIVVPQAFGYKNHQKECKYVIISNFEKLRFYIDNAIDFQEFNLFTLTENDFNLLYLCLHIDNIFSELPAKIKQASTVKEQDVTKQLYKDYSTFKSKLFTDIVQLNPQYDKLILFKKSQKLLDRILFILFAEDRGLLQANTIQIILDEYENLKKLDAYQPLYQRFKKHFNYLNEGFKNDKYEVFGYNGGLFANDKILDNILISDNLLLNYTPTLAKYDYETDVDVNILGHIFEHSLNDIEEIQAELDGKEIDKTKTKRKKDGVFYTPKYITKYIVENTVGALCTEKRKELEIIDDNYTPDKRKAHKAALKNKLDNYQSWLLQITIVDPACGSGAFLNQALDFLIQEHKNIDELRAQLLGESMVLPDHEVAILENNIFGVDLNEESVEIARLSLWLRTAQKGRKLNSLNNNIKCGNSLIDDASIAGEKAFNWHKEFPQIFNKSELGFAGLKDELDAEIENKQIQKSHNKSELGFAGLKDELDAEIENKQIQKSHNKSELGFAGLKDELDAEIENKQILKSHNKSELGFAGLKDELDVKIENKHILKSHNKSELGFAGLKDELDAEIENKKIQKSKNLINPNSDNNKNKSGFDVVIGNPPYLSMTKNNSDNVWLQYYVDKYESIKISNSKNLFTLFNELGSIILKKDGVLSFIIPEGFLKTRSYDSCVVQMEKVGIISKAVYFENWVFDDATTGSLIFEFYKNKNKRLQFKEYLCKQNLEIVEKIEVLNPVLEKYNKIEFPCIKESTTTFKGMAVQDRSQNIFQNKDNLPDRFLLGNCIGRYVTTNEFYCDYSKLVIVGGTKKLEKHNIAPRILIRRTGDSLCCTLLQEKALTESTLYSCSILDYEKLQIKYVLAILNSKFYTYIVRQKMITNEQAFPQILMTDFEELKLPIIDKENQQPFIEKAEIMLQKNKELQTIKSNVIKILQSQYSSININTKISKWNELDFKDFCKELEKQKIKLTISEKAELLQYFEAEQTKANSIQQTINQTDAAIDTMVYKLYELSDEEIKIVENN